MRAARSENARLIGCETLIFLLAGQFDAGLD
jgi:hypothetical protein